MKAKQMKKQAPGKGFRGAPAAPAKQYRPAKSWPSPMKGC